jgi:hypothetical protein
MHLAIDRWRVAFAAAALAVLVFDFFIMHGQKQGLQMYDQITSIQQHFVLD